MWVLLDPDSKNNEIVTCMRQLFGNLNADGLDLLSSSDVKLVFFFKNPYILHLC